MWESRRLPASGAGPSPDRLLLGSEGTLAVITEAWVRVLPREMPRWSARVELPDFAAGLDAVREIVQAGLLPSNCRLIEPREAALTMAGDGSAALLLLGFEAVTEPAVRALAICSQHGGPRERGHRPRVARRVPARAVPARHARGHGRAHRDVRERDHMGAPAGVRGDRQGGHRGGARRRRRRHLPADARVRGRRRALLHGVAPARRGDEEEQWALVKRAASEAILAAGGTITHHHAVGRDHREFYERQRPAPFAAALRAAKAELDPDGRLNPGVLFAP